MILQLHLISEGLLVTCSYDYLSEDWNSKSYILFAWIFAGDVGLDVYTRAVSEVYQDLLGEGVYVGKGIHDVDAFARSLQGKVPENTLVSHDLFEGLHGRVALATDIVVYEDYPPHYAAYLHRAHRWVRGDWQLIPWLKRRVPRSDGQRRRNLLSTLEEDRPLAVTRAETRESKM